MVPLQALYDEDDPDCPYRKVRVAMPQLRRRSKTISEFAEFAKGMFIRARRFRKDLILKQLTAEAEIFVIMENFSS